MRDPAADPIRQETVEFLAGQGLTVMVGTTNDGAVVLGGRYIGSACIPPDVVRQVRDYLDKVLNQRRENERADDLYQGG